MNSNRTPPYDPLYEQASEVLSYTPSSPLKGGEGCTAAEPSPEAVRSAGYLADIERALDALLRAMIAEDAKRATTIMEPMVAKPFTLTSMKLPTRAEMDMRALLREPVRSACRQGVRKLGVRLFEVMGNTDGMREVAERVADMDPSRSGHRLAMTDSAWDGIGRDGDRWVA